MRLSFATYNEHNNRIQKTISLYHKACLAAFNNEGNKFNYKLI